MVEKLIICVLQFFVHLFPYR